MAGRRAGGVKRKGADSKMALPPGDSACLFVKDAGSGDPTP